MRLRFPRRLGQRQRSQNGRKDRKAHVQTPEVLPAMAQKRGSSLPSYRAKLVLSWPAVAVLSPCSAPPSEAARRTMPATNCAIDDVLAWLHFSHATMTIRRRGITLSLNDYERLPSTGP